MKFPFFLRLLNHGLEPDYIYIYSSRITLRTELLIQAVPGMKNDKIIILAYLKTKPVPSQLAFRIEYNVWPVENKTLLLSLAVQPQITDLCTFYILLWPSAHKSLFFHKVLTIINITQTTTYFLWIE